MTDRGDRRGSPARPRLIAVLTVVTRIAGFGRTLVFLHTVGDGRRSATSTTPPTPSPTSSSRSSPAARWPAWSCRCWPGRSRPATGARVGAVASALLTWVLPCWSRSRSLVALAAEPIVGLLPGVPGRRTATVAASMLRVFAPQLPLYGIGIVLTGVLQAHRRFAWPVLAPLLSSVTVMGAYLALRGGRRRRAATSPGSAATGRADPVGRHHARRRGADAVPGHPGAPAGAAAAAGVPVPGRRGPAAVAARLGRRGHRRRPAGDARRGDRAGRRPAALTASTTPRRRCSCCPGRCWRCRSPPRPTRRWPRRRATATSAATARRWPAPPGRWCCWPGSARPRWSRWPVPVAAPGRDADGRPPPGIAGVRARPVRLRAVRAALPGPLRARRDGRRGRRHGGRLGGRRGRRAGAGRRARPTTGGAGAGPGQLGRHVGARAAAGARGAPARRSGGAGRARPGDRGRYRGGRSPPRLAGWARGDRRRAVGRAPGRGAASCRACWAASWCSVVVRRRWRTPLDRRDVRPLLARLTPRRRGRASSGAAGRGRRERRGRPRGAVRWRWCSPPAPAASASTSPRWPRGLIAAGCRGHGLRPGGHRRAVRLRRGRRRVRRRWRSRPARSPQDAGAVRALRRALRRPRRSTWCTRTACAPGSSPRWPGRRVPLVVTWHNAVLARGLRGQASRAGRADRGARRRRSPSAPRPTWSSGPRRSAPATPGSARSPRPRWPPPSAARAAVRAEFRLRAGRPADPRRSAGCTRRSGTTC